ncbi:hypothetical protein NE237_027175 [Protea cynaroides]|uniref:S-type anion channel SLAH2-like n=1 Tax=Protea cynaroides TaxID=273540 RepID=A0A9Q0JU58_9MAGN|nr:hypothetical protein NE237_027175 [Protea cynaroides]
MEVVCDANQVMQNRSVCKFHYHEAHMRQSKKAPLVMEFQRIPPLEQRLHLLLKLKDPIFFNFCCFLDFLDLLLPLNPWCSSVLGEILNFAFLLRLEFLFSVDAFRSDVLKLSICAGEGVNIQEAATRMTRIQISLTNLQDGSKCLHFLDLYNQATNLADLAISSVEPHMLSYAPGSCIYASQLEIYGLGYVCLMMDDGAYLGSAEQLSPEELPSLFKFLTPKRVAGFDDVQDSSPSHLCQQTWLSTSCPSPDCALAKGLEMHSISISMPSSPLRIHLESSKRVIFSEHDERSINNGNPNPPATSIATSTKHPKHAKFYSQPIPASTAYAGAAINGESPKPVGNQQKNPRIHRLEDRQFDSFKTWSGKLKKQCEPEQEINVLQNAEVEALPVHRYFDALEGPELDTLRASEELVLPEDKKWPFLLRYPISSFGICLGVSSQAILWKTLATSKSMSFLHISLTANLVLWCIAVALMVTVFFIYSLKVIFYFEAVRREYYHPVRVNFFFAPWIASLFLVLGVPPLVAENLHAALWYILMTPIFCLELKIYGQWMSGGQRRLSKVANPSNHLSVVGNFVGAMLGASMGLKEGPIFFFAVGLAHYMVLFVTLYQRLPTNEMLPKELHPVFFLFVAAPSVASVAWAQMQGLFDYGSRIVYFIALFLYFSLAVRINFFRGFRFSLAWWAYTFPMTGASIAAIRYSNEVTNLVTQILSVVLSGISIFTVMALLITTILHAFVLRDLFPNDIAIAISEKRRPKAEGKKRFHLPSESTDAKDIDASLKPVSSADQTEASLKPATSTCRDIGISLESASSVSKDISQISVEV